MKPLFLALLAVAVCAAPGFCDWQNQRPTDFTVADPPARNSAGDVADMNAILQLQATRSKADCAEAAAEKSPDFHSLWDGSGLLSQAELDAVSGIGDETSKLAANVSGFFKKKFGRARPYNEDSRVQPCADKPGGNTAYPSTHATSGELDACVLAEIFPPDRAAALKAYGKRIGDLRVIAGVHHPTDVVAGQTLADEICAVIKPDPTFMAEVARIRATLPAP